MKTKQRCQLMWGAISLLLLSGCLTGNIFRTQNPFDDPSGTPGDQSFEVPDRHSSNSDPRDTSTFKPNGSLQLPVTPKDNSSEPKTKEDKSNLDGPRIIPQGIEVPANLQLTVEAAAKRQVGSSVTFRLRLRNSGSLDALQVSVECLFDAGFVFPGYPEKKITRSFEKIAAGTSKEFSLTLTADTVGKHGCQFRVTQEKREQEWKSVEVDFIPRQLQSSLIGPPKRFVGNRVEYTLKVSNVGEEILNGTEMQLRFPDALFPKEASRGAKQHSDMLSWEVGPLKPGEGIQVQAEFECRKPNAKACVSLQAQATDLPETITESCLEISAVTDRAILHLSDSDDPIKIGDVTDYTIVVENPTSKSLNLLQLTTVVPERFRIVSMSSSKNDKALEWKSQIDGSTIVFDAIPELKPLEKQQFQVQVNALSAGDARFEATLSSSLSQTKSTLIEFTSAND